MADQKIQPDNPSSAFSIMAPRWNLINALLGGTETMRSAGEAYLPKHQEETSESYDRRLACSVLTNYVSVTLEGLVGRPFSQEVGVGDGVPAQVRALLEDVDLKGNKLDIFAREWFQEGVAKGFAHVLVEMPRQESRVGEDGQPIARTLADDRAEGIRPYWCLVKPEDVVAAYTRQVGEYHLVEHLRIREDSVERAGFDEAHVKRVRQMDFVGPGVPVQVTMWRKKPDADEWFVEDEWTIGLDFIPLVTFYAVRPQASFVAKPPLTDLANLNISHWQSDSDQRNILSVARFPILAASGVDPEAADLRVGPHNYLATQDPQGRFYYVEHGGAAIAAGAADLESLEERMKAYGAEFLRRRPGDVTATERALDSAESVSPLQAMVLSFEDALATAAAYTARWYGDAESDGGEFEVHTDFTQDASNPEIAAAVLEARKLRDISRRYYLQRLKELGILGADFDPEEDAALLEGEAETSPELQGMVGPDGTAATGSAPGRGLPEADEQQPEE